MTFETFARVEALESSTKVVPGPGPYGVNGRKATTKYVVSEAGGERVVVSLTTSHRKESKAFSSILTWEVDRSEGAFVVSSWGSDHLMVRVAQEPVARYSAKALEAAHAEALAALEAGFDDRGLYRVFEQAEAKQGIGAVS